MGFLAFVSMLFVSAATIAASFTITASTDTVTVRRGEQLQLSCHIESAVTSVVEVRWYRGPDPDPYVSQRVIGCGFSNIVPCPYAITTDYRGVLNYEVGIADDATLTLIVDQSRLEDNTTFSCGAIMDGSTAVHRAEISVIVYYLPNVTYPICSVILHTSEISGTPSILTCSSENAQPGVSLEWTVSENVSPPNDTTVTRNRVENRLNLQTLLFTCHVRSEAYPNVRRNCSIGPLTSPNSSISQTTEGAETVLITESTTATSTSEQGQRESPTSSQLASSPSSDGYQSTLGPSSQTGISLTPIIDATEPVCSSTVTALSVALAAAAAVVFLLLITSAHLTISMKKLRKKIRRMELRSTNMSIISSGGQIHKQPRDASLQNPSDGKEDHVNSSPQREHAYATSIGELPQRESDKPRQTVARDTDSSSVGTQPPTSATGYTPYIVPDHGENGANRAAQDSGYTPLVGMLCVLLKAFTGRRGGIKM